MKLNTQHDPSVQEVNNASNEEQTIKLEHLKAHDIMDQFNVESQHEKTKEKYPSHDESKDQSNTEFLQHKTKEDYIDSVDDVDSVDGAEESAVDFIMVWKKPNGGKQESCLFHRTDEMKRNIFEENLKQEGLVLNKHYNGNLCFVTIYTPRHVLLTYAEIMKLRMPLRTLVQDNTDRGGSKGTTISNLCMKTASTVVQLFFPAPLETDQQPIEKSHFTAEYVKAKHYLFDEEHSEFLSAPTRSLIVDFILSRESYSSNTNDLLSVGIERLVQDGVYKAAYPLHDGDYKNEQGGQSLRYTLYEEWAKLKNLFKPQPADQIKHYLGVKCAFYFLWLGFYTRMLILASVLGCIVIFYGLFTLNSDTLSRDICNETLNIIMCPLSDKTCNYWKLSDSCITAKITYLFDNTFSVVFAFLMSIWAVLFLELWKRYSACLTHRWDLSRFTLKAEHPRPNYFARVSRLKRTVTELNSVTGAEEQTAPVYIKWPTRVLSFSVVLLFMAIIALFIVLIVIVFKISLKTLFLKDKDYNREWMNDWGDYIIQLAVILMNLLGIKILNYIFDKLSLCMTESEYMRTQTEFDESLTTKMYLFKFSNYYSGIFYIAFLKGKFVGYPGKYARIAGARQEECSAGGCLWDLFCYLAVFLTLKQILHTLVENLMPFFWNTWKAYRTKREHQEPTDRHVTGNPMEADQRTVLDIETTQNTGNIAGVDDSEENSYARPSISTIPKIPTTTNTLLKGTASISHPGASQWLKDFNLNAWGTRELFPEYLEMIIQYGFVVLFITAFPLAPLLALINNMFETRLDAQKFLKYYRRPVPHRVTNIGIWYQILDGVAQLAVISNAIIIAFNSNFVPRMVYRYVISPHGTDEGFLNHSLAFFNTSDFDPSDKPNCTVTMCRYSAYRHPPWVTLKYNRSQDFWIILVARLVFIILFLIVVSISMNILKWLIPDVPAKLKNRMKREEYLTSELMFDHETKRAANKRILQYASNEIKNITDASSSSATSGENKIIKFYTE
uniref:Anoctamin n=1 Tax=Cacopsylla melanoneura TaxID=428564 RepID=A0A8D9FI56_9HEMI